jgi:hypothetical protein
MGMCGCPPDEGERRFQDHCKAIFDKTGTRSRSELRALVFFQDHLPAIAVRTPLDAGGHLDVIESSYAHQNRNLNGGV